MPPFCLPKSTKILQKSDPKRHQNFDRFLLRFFLDFGSVLEPTWGHVGPQDAPKTPSRRPKMPSPNATRFPRTRPARPKTPQDAPRHPQDAPKAPKTLPRRRFWKDFGDILEDFGKIFGRLLGRISCPTCLLKLTFQEPPEVLINWRD